MKRYQQVIRFLLLLIVSFPFTAQAYHLDFPWKPIQVLRAPHLKAQAYVLGDTGEVAAIDTFYAQVAYSAHCNDKTVRIVLAPDKATDFSPASPPPSPDMDTWSYVTGWSNNAK